MAKWADDLRKQAAELARTTEDAREAFDEAWETWAKDVIAGKPTGDQPSDQDKVKAWEEAGGQYGIATVAVGVTNQGEAYGWSRWAILLGPNSVWYSDYDGDHTAYEYARKRMRKNGLRFEGLQTWDAKKIAGWRNWLSDPRKPRA